MTLINSDMPLNRLIGNATLSPRGEGEICIVSQEAVISGKIVKITLTFNHDIDASQARKAMNENLDKIVQLATAYKLGESDESHEITRSLKVHKDDTVTRSFVKEKFMKENVGRLFTTTHHSYRVQNYIRENPIDAEIAGPVSVEIAYAPVNNFPPPIKPKINLSANESLNKGKYITDTFVIDNVVVARESAYRAETVSMLIDGLNAKIKGLDAKINTLEKSDVVELERNPKLQESLRNAKSERDKAEEDLEKCIRNTQGATHASMNAPRFAFFKMGRETAKAEMVPVLSNLRMHTVEDAHGTIVSAVTRSAAISDFRYGEVSLQELKDLRDLEKCLWLTKNGLRTPEERRAENKMKDFYLNGDESGDIGDLALLVRTKALVGYGAEALVVDSFISKPLTDLLEKIRSASTIEAKFKKLTPEEKSLLRELIIDDKKLKEVIDGRSNYLKHNILQDLQLHLETTPVSNNGSVLYARTGLLDMQKPSVKQAGCIMHDRNQGLDMKGIFDELKGAKLIFDDDIGAAYVDEEGAIHMPKSCALEGVEGATLSAVFFNICVQGATLNKGVQKAINDQALQELEEKFGETRELSALKESLESLETNNNDPNESVLLVTQFIQSMGGYSGINCFGGKDRTGYSVAVITHAKVAKLAGISILSRPMKRIGHQLLSSRGVAAKIAEDNADHTVLKVTRFDLLLYDTGSLRGKMLRVAHAVNAVFVAVKPMLKSFFGFSPILASSTPGQLYKDEVQTSHKTSSIFDRFMSLWRSKRDDLEEVEIEIRESV